MKIHHMAHFLLYRKQCMIRTGYTCSCVSLSGTDGPQKAARVRASAPSTIVSTKIPKKQQSRRKSVDIVCYDERQLTAERGGSKVWTEGSFRELQCTFRSNAHKLRDSMRCHVERVHIEKKTRIRAVPLDRWDNYFGTT